MLLCGFGRGLRKIGLPKQNGLGGSLFPPSMLSFPTGAILIQIMRAPVSELSAPLPVTQRVWTAPKR